MRGQVKVTVSYLVESDTEYYSDELYGFPVGEPSESKLVKGIQRDFVESDCPLEEICVTGGMTIESTEFVKWL